MIEKDELVSFHKKGEKTGVIFTSMIVGGHEIMTLAIIEQILTDNPECLSEIILYIPFDNAALIDKVKKKGYQYQVFFVAHRRMEIVHAFLNFKFLGECAKALKKVKAENDHIVLVQGDIQQGSGFIIASKLTGTTLTSYIPFAHSYKVMNAPGYKIKDTLANVIYRMCNEYITISSCFKDDLLLLNPKASVHLIKNSVPKSTKKYISKCLGKEDVINIFIIGRVHIQKKGHDILIDALKNIYDYKIRLNIVGDGPDRDTVIAKAETLPPNITLKYFGWVDDSWSVADSANVLVIPSRYEGVPLVMLEAIERGLPVVAVARDGMKDYLPADWLYAPGDDESEALKLKLSEIFHKITDMENYN